MGLNQTITVINKSGKIVSSSKHIVNVFKEAKSAYLERKAEIAAERKAAAAHDRELRTRMRALRFDDDNRSSTSRHSRHSRRSDGPHRSRTTRHSSRPPLERGYTDGFYADDAVIPRPAQHAFDDDLAGGAGEAQIQPLQRRHTDWEAERPRRRSSIDMDLAYGDLPPQSPPEIHNDEEWKEQASKLTMLLDEANCLQHSVNATIENLQQNPDALAAVALTLAEISALVSKMGPGVLTALKGSFPAVAALLVSPHFMIAAGVGVGVTIVALGGYKIIKRLQAQKEEPLAPMPMPAAMPMPMPMPMPTPMPMPVHMPMSIAPDAAEEPYLLDELETRELSRIEKWRRGIADVEADSQGTTVDGEFITPGASRQLVAEGILDEEDLKSRRSSRIKEDGERRHKSHRAKSVKSTRSTKTTGSSRTKTEKESSSSSSKSKSKKKKEKEPSGLRMLFRRGSH